MSSSYKKSLDFPKQTKKVLLFSGIFNEPLVALIVILPFIMRRELQATLWQITIFSMLRPTMSLFSFYWGAILEKRKDLLRSNLIGAWLLARIGFLFLPLFPSPTFAIICTGLYYLFYRAGTPALMQILHINLAKDEKEKIFSLSSMLNFIVSTLLGLFIGKFLESNRINWSIYFSLSALLALSIIFFQKKLPIKGECSFLLPQSNYPTLAEKILAPWKMSFSLMQKNRAFREFQIGFMLGGAGLMLMAPAATLFYADILQVSYQEISVSRLIYMGIGFTLASNLWRKSLSKFSFTLLTSFLCFGFALFILLILSSLMSITFLYMAFFLYGLVQAGSHLIWHLSGSHFASNKEESSSYTNASILTVGLRGALLPLLGGVFCKLLSPGIVLGMSCLCCASGGFYLLLIQRKLYLLSEDN